MTFTAEDVVERLEDAGVRLDRGLTEADLKRIEKKYAFTFGPDQRALLRLALPLGDTWLNWRHATPARIRQRLAWPVESVLFGVTTEVFWPPSWGPRPDAAASAEATARQQLAKAPVLVPLYGQHYLPAAPEPAGSPVFCVQRAEVRIHADDLLNYTGVEFGIGEQALQRDPAADLPEITFWSGLADELADKSGDL